MSTSRKLCPLVAFLLALTVRGASGAELPEVVPVDGQRQQAELVAADADWKLTFRAGKDEHRLSAADLVRWGAPVEPKGRVKLPGRFPPAEVVLNDGGLLVVDIKRSKGKRILAQSMVLSDLEVPLSRVRSILFRPPIDRQRRDALAKGLRDPAAEADRLVLVNGDVVSGRVTRFVMDENKEKETKRPVVEIEVGGEPVKIDAGRIAGVAFKPQLGLAEENDKLRAIVGFSDGTRLVAAGLQVAGDDVRVELSRGIVWKASSKDDLVFIQPLGGKVTYVSDLLVPTRLDDGSDSKGTFVGKPPRQKAARYKYVPYLTIAWPYYADQNVRGTQLRSGGRLYLKGLGMHSGGAITLALPGRYRRFEAEVALDDYVGKRGSVVYNVKVYGRKDGRVGVVRQFTSKIVRGGLAPVPISVDLNGAVGVSLSVLFGQRGDERDHANWLNARLVR